MDWKEETEGDKRDRKTENWMKEEKKEGRREGKTGSKLYGQEKS